MCRDEEADVLQSEPAVPLSPVATGFYAREDEWLPVG